MRLADTQALALALGVTPATIRTWARRGKLTRHGTRDARRRTLYNLDQAARLERQTDTARDKRPAG